MGEIERVQALLAEATRVELREQLYAFTHIYTVDELYTMIDLIKYLTPGFRPDRE